MIMAVALDYKIIDIHVHATPWDMLNSSAAATMQAGQPNHALLQELGVSCPELDRLVRVARDAGAVGFQVAEGRFVGDADAPLQVSASFMHFVDLDGELSDTDHGVLQRLLEYGPKHVESNEFDPAHPPAGRRIRVVFKDGEVLIGTTTGYQPGRPGFFLVPADSDSNVERCYIVTAATREVKFI